MRVLIAFSLATGLVGPLTAQQPDSLPPGVTAQMIETGKLLFEGPGVCTACHGRDGKGITGVGSNLTDTTWVHNDGSYEGILAQIKTGVLPEHSQSGRRMPERGASSLTDKQLAAVAAYVWSLSRQTKS